MKLDFRQRLLGTTLMVGASMLATPAFAQEAPATDPAAQTPTGPVEAAPVPDTAATGAPVEETRDIVVTGTRIPSANLESVAPVTVVSGQDFKLSGNTRVEDLLNSLPSVGASQASGVSNGASGTAEVDLRYLGSKRTLVLVNGRRLAPGDPNSTTQAADLNMIPSAIVKRAEVLTGGASSTYGADAVAGVVNFIMDTNFTGIRFDGQYSLYQHSNSCPGLTDGVNGTVCDALNAKIGQGLNGYAFPGGSVADGGTFDGTVAIGTGFDDDRGHIMGYFGYRKVKAIKQDRRDFSACGLSGGGANITCGGSATSAEGNVLLFDNGTSTAFTFDQNNPGNIIPGIAGGAFINQFNFNPYNYFQRPDERYIAGVFANYEVTPAINPYLEFMFMDDHTLAQIAPSGDFGNTFTINCEIGANINPLMSQAAEDIICDDENLINGFLGTFPVASGAPYNTGAPGSGTPGPGAPPLVFTDSTGTQYNLGYFNLLRRNVEGGPRIADLTHTNFRGVLGTKGDLSDVWSYDAYYQYGRTNYSLVYKNEFSVSRLNRALNVVTDNRVGSPTEGQAICRSVLDNSDPNCIPYDIFGTPSEAAINYLNVFGVIQGRTAEQIANVNFTGALGDWGVKTPWAEDGVGVNFGLEYRKETLILNPDQEFQTGDLTGQGAPTLAVDGNFNVKEFFAEAQIPIVQNSFFHELTLTAGYRKSWYATHSNTTEGVDRKYDTDTYKVGLEFAPIKDVRFRAGYNRAVRAPNIQELFAPQFVGLDGSTDPCAGHAIDASDPADAGCIATGLVDGQTTPANPAEQYNGLLGGQPNLNPEKATTKTLGVILEPRFLPRFALTVDWWHIKLDGAIQGFGADTILADCNANTTDPLNPAPSCALIHRNPGGSLWLSPDGFVEDIPTNVGGIKTSGFDFNASYSHRLGGLGNLSASFIGTWLKKYVTDNGLADPYDCAGFYGSVCSGGSVSSTAPLPKWRHKMRTTLQMPNGIGVSLQWRMMGKVQHERNSDDEALAGTPPVLSDKVKAQHYIDLATTYSFGDHYNFRLGVNNIFDNDPPLITASNGSCPAGPCNGNTYPGTWDALGRYIYAGVTLDF